MDEAACALGPVMAPCLLRVQRENTSLCSFVALPVLVYFFWEGNAFVFDGGADVIFRDVMVCVYVLGEERAYVWGILMCWWRHVCCGRGISYVWGRSARMLEGRATMLEGRCCARGRRPNLTPCELQEGKGESGEEEDSLKHKRATGAEKKFSSNTINTMDQSRASRRSSENLWVVDALESGLNSRLQASFAYPPLLHSSPTRPPPPVRQVLHTGSAWEFDIFAFDELCQSLPGRGNSKSATILCFHLLEHHGFAGMFGIKRQKLLNWLTLVEEGAQSPPREAGVLRTNHSRHTTRFHTTFHQHLFTCAWSQGTSSPIRTTTPCMRRT